ncbi:NAD(P)/FAD-dependent oxidoreductase [uncultured Tenacibaculum sp.]|uniref:NAD(P)/FAD-dependent oxidoreductase n=1 Tax=uncultured Tenacibaculum sp. TaxID=174713 RepID=UPI002613F26A|nr:NAD(P)/FAD-dependent oxidoreductase [uncultured Tenacibaculum sp.]
MVQNKVVIVGGGLAGLVSAIHLAKKGISVTVIEKNTYPKHKVCGEYISNEVLPYLQSLGFDPLQFQAKEITDFTLSTSSNTTIKTKLPLGGFGISRYTLDYELAKLAKQNGVEIIHDYVSQIDFQNEIFTITTKSNKTFTADIVIGAYGKRSNIDISLKRSFIQQKSPFLAVKAHYKGEFPEDKVSLYNFKGGYCGVSKVENDHINVCYITSYDAFKKYTDIDEFQNKVLLQNKQLQEIIGNSKLMFPSPLTISQISFAEKQPVENHMLMCGDTAGMIHPLCGNGMAMAIHSAQIASEIIIQYFNKEISTRKELEEIYTREWKKAFNKRLRMGRKLAALFNMDFFSEMITLGLRLFPWILPIIIKKTHGKYLKPIQ